MSLAMGRSIIGPAIRAGETLALDPNMTEADALAHWMAADKETFVAEEDGLVLARVSSHAVQLRRQHK